MNLLQNRWWWVTLYRVPGERCGIVAYARGWAVNVYVPLADAGLAFHVGLCARARRFDTADLLPHWARNRRERAHD